MTSPKKRHFQQCYFYLPIFIRLFMWMSMRSCFVHNDEYAIKIHSLGQCKPTSRINWFPQSIGSLCIVYRSLSTHQFYCLHSFSLHTHTHTYSLAVLLLTAQICAGITYASVWWLEQINIIWGIFSLIKHCVLHHLLYYVNKCSVIIPPLATFCHFARR